MDTSAGSVSGGGDLSSMASLQAALPRSMSSILSSRPSAATVSSPPHTTRSSCAPPAGAPLAATVEPSPLPPAGGSLPAAADGSPPAAADGSPSGASDDLLPAAAAGTFLPTPGGGSPPTPDAGPSPGNAAGGSSPPPTLSAPVLPPLPHGIRVPALVRSGLPAEDYGESPLSRAQRDARANEVASHREHLSAMAASQKIEHAVEATLLRDVGRKLCGG